VTRPVAFVTLSNKYKINETVLKKHIETLSQNGEIHYKVSGGVYVPDCFAKIQKKTLQDFYLQHKYIDYKLATSLQI